MSNGRPSYGPSAPQNQQGQRTWRGFRLIFIPRYLARQLHEDHMELLDEVRNIGNLIMATKDEVTAAIAALGVKVDAFIASQSGQTAEEVQALLDAQKEKLTAEDATMDAADFAEFAAGITAITNRVPPKFDPSGNAG